jgi:hypothetical protein
MQKSIVIDESAPVSAPTSLLEHDRVSLITSLYKMIENGDLETFKNVIKKIYANANEDANLMRNQDQDQDQDQDQKSISKSMNKKIFHKDELNMLFVTACQENALPFVIYLWSKFGVIEAYDGVGYDDPYNDNYHKIIELHWKRYMCIAMAIQSGSYNVLKWMDNNKIIHRKDYIHAVGLDELFYDMEEDITYDPITQKVALWMFDHFIVPTECTPSVYEFYMKNEYD